ncbi:hypothetical protein E5676_scaffold298G00230 [Cucumis melo var. makuwa]|uniref:Uncharacterized protein n=1 Tax=Cucumis melo var. makuwa TaxID=1194695 RepID=A0A5D3BU68_CUCMM|nr:hypothetical protein E5676_scaffold298G00230 [Cucumis melo var. makuwa]
MASAEANHIWVLVGSSNDPSNILGLYFLKSLKCLAFANSWSRTFCGSTLGHEQGLARSVGQYRTIPIHLSAYLVISAPL